MAFHQTFVMPASYMNTILALDHYTTATEQAQELYQQAVNSTVHEEPQQQQQQRHIRVSTITFTAPTTATIPAIWRTGSLDRGQDGHPGRQYHMSDSTASVSEYFPSHTNNNCALSRRPTPSPPPNHHHHTSSDSTAPISSYVTGHTDDRGKPLNRRPTPYPRRNICGVSITSTDSCDSCSSFDSKINSEASWSEGDDAAWTREPGPGDTGYTS